MQWETRNKYQDRLAGRNAQPRFSNVTFNLDAASFYDTPLAMRPDLSTSQTSSLQSHIAETVSSQDSTSFAQDYFPSRHSNHGSQEMVACDSFGSERPMVGTRSSLTLAQTYLLRGTTSAVLLDGCGARLRGGTTGGIGQRLNHSGDDEYDKSFPVERLDIFLSHSWHASWFLKYITLLLHFNGFPAAVVAVIVGICVFGVKVLAQHLLPPESHLRNMLVGVRTNYNGIRFVCFPIGSVVFLLVLLTWHRIRNRIVLSGQSIFLDKVCIHQTDMTEKTLGIKSIGAILNNTERVVIAWDETYFERLWCTYELAAFKVAQPRGNILLLPISLGGAIATNGVLVFLTEVVRMCVIEYTRYEYGDAAPIEPLPKSYYEDMFPGISLADDVLYFTNTFQLIFLITSIFVSGAARRYGRDLILLNQQLENFSVRQSKCFCCCNDHVLPGTELELACDRMLVFNSIAHWHGWEDEDTGLDSFDKLIQNELREDICVGLSGLACIPYQWALVASLWGALVWLDYVSCLTQTTYLCKAWLVADRLFMRYPIVLACTVWLGVRFPRPICTSTTVLQRIKFLVYQFFISCCISLVLHPLLLLHNLATSYMISHQDLDWINVLFVTVEVYLTLFLYNGMFYRLYLRAKAVFGRCIRRAFLVRKEKQTLEVEMASKRSTYII